MAKDNSNEVASNGVVERTDLGNGLELVKGAHGEVAVFPKELPMDAETQQAYIDAAIENSATPVEEDPRHSSHPDFVNPDSSPVDTTSSVTGGDESRDAK